MKWVVSAPDSCQLQLQARLGCAAVEPTALRGRKARTAERNWLIGLRVRLALPKPIGRGKSRSGLNMRFFIYFSLSHFICSFIAHFTARLCLPAIPTSLECHQRRESSYSISPYLHLRHAEYMQGIPEAPFEKRGPRRHSSVLLRPSASWIDNCPISASTLTRR